MKLLLDIGNSRVKWAWLDAGALRDAGSLAHGGVLPAGWPGVTGVPGRVPAAVLVASVAAEPLTRALVEPLAAGGVPLHRAAVEREAAGVRNGYADVRQLGVDRWLGVLAAWGRHRGAVCVVDAGTAVTVDAVDAAGQHLGGFIVPGAGLMRRALLERTGGIGPAAGIAVAADTAPGPWGRHTAACIDRGAWLALSCLVRGCMEALATAARPAAPRLVLTGGDAARLLPLVDGAAEHRPLLVLEGLALRHGGVDDAP